MNFVALDFETANELRNSACSIGLVRVQDGHVTDRFYTLIKPEPARFSYWNIKIHGIRPEDVADAPTFGEAWLAIRDFIGSDTVVAHNASFDMSVLRFSLDQYGLPYPEIPYFCTVTAAKQAFPHLVNHKLNTVSDHVGFSFCHHNALEDAEACAMVLIGAMKATGSANLKAFCKCICSSFGRLHSSGYTPSKRSTSKPSRG